MNLVSCFGVELSTVEDILPYGRKLIEQGVKHVIVSMAGEGALLFTQKVYMKRLFQKVL